MTRVAALDCGTNSLRLLVADVANGQVDDLVRRMEVVRLGEGVDRTGRLSPAALARTFGVLEEYARIVDDLGAERVRMVATSATRDADNSDEFVAGVRDRLGVAPDVVTGDEEAQLSFDGATAELRGTARFASPYLVVDIGGGSTEFILGDDHGVWAARSVDIGCVRMTERRLHDDPPSEEQVTATVRDIDAAIEAVASSVDLTAAATLVGLAGSVTTVAALALGLPEYDAQRIHHTRIAATDLHRVAKRLLESRRDERGALPAMHPGRVDVIGGGALILDRILHRTDLDDVVASEHDILDGIALSAGGSAGG